MSSLPRVESSLDLLDNLKEAVCEFTTRENKLQQDIRVKIASVRRRRDESLEALNTKLAEDLRQAETTFAETKAALENRFHRRTSRILNAHKTSKKRALQAVDDREGSRKHKLQTETLQAKRSHDTGLVNAENALTEFKAVLATEQASMTALEADAAGAFKGYRKFVRLLGGGTAPAPEPAPDADEHQLLAQLQELLAKTATDLKRFRRKLLPAMFRFIPVWVILIVCLPAVVPVLQHFGNNTFGYHYAIGAAVGCLVLGVVLHQLGKNQAEPEAKRIAASLQRARRLHDVAFEKCEVRHTEELARVENDFNAMNEWIGHEWTRAIEEAEADRHALPRRMEEKADRASTRNEYQHRWILDHREKERTESIASLNSTAQAQRQELESNCADKEAKLNAENEAQWRLMETEWKTRLQPFYDTIAAANADADRRFPPWDPPLWANWAPPPQFGNSAKFARMEVEVEKLADGLPKDPRLALPGPVRFGLPLALSYPSQGSILFETTHSGRDAAVAALNNIVLRLLSTAPAGRLSFTLVDPVSLGQSFSGVMHLADHAEHLINGRIWTQPAQIEQRLADLNEHMEKVIQMYLRNEYATIADYNEQAGNIAEKYHFVVVADFPSGFTDAAAKRLLSIASSGARCGVFTLIHWDRRLPMPQDFVPEELRKSSVCVASRGQEFTLSRSLPGTTLRLDAPPAPEFAIEFIHKVGLRSKDSNRVEVPFAQIAPADNERWSLDTTSELTVPIGRTGATKFQYLAIGKGTRQHALLAGKTGSGKSTLFHVIITNLALWCNPDQVEFYLIDFKKGVEFKCYASNHLPHARVVAIESDREFGLSVLQRLDDELKRRGDMFRALGVQDIAGYKRAGGTEPIPRSLLIIDEFQEFFVEDDKIAQTASLLFDRIVRQGRAFGIHVLLGSQTLGGAYTVARTTLGQMVIRIALQCNEADAYLIMDDNNPAPRLLSRPGEGIYNDTAGTVEGNSPFQVVWLPDQVRDDYLHQVRERADRSGARFPGPIVFEGNAPTDVRENIDLQGRLEAQSIPPKQIPRIWLGAPNSIKGPTEAVFHRQSGNNLLVVGQRDEASLAIVAVALVSLAVQFLKNSVRIVLCDGSPPGTAPRELLDKIVQAIPHPVTSARQGDLPEIMKNLDDEMTRRADDPNASEAPPVFLIIHGLQKFNKLRHEEDFGFSTSDADAAPNPAVLLNKLLTEGTRHGIHVIATCDTFNNVNRFLSRKAFSEFEMRVLFQMSANDSASLIDSPKASTLGLHRALFYNEQEGYLETFRPYALPAAEWIAETGRHLTRLLTES